MYFDVFSQDFYRFSISSTAFHSFVLVKSDPSLEMEALYFHVAQYYSLGYIIR